jgi:hypothetical protein
MPIVATAVLLEVQVPPLVALLKEVVLPTQTVSVPNIGPRVVPLTVIALVAVALPQPLVTV